MVSIDSGAFRLMRDVDFSKQPQRSKVYTAWITAFSSDVPDAVEHLAEIVEDVYEYELWKDQRLDTAEQFFERMGILGLELDEPAKLIKALRSKDAVTIKKIVAANQARSLHKEGKSTRQIATETKQSQSTVQRQVNRVHDSDRKVTQYKISQYTTPETAAMKIRAKFGDDFANQLKEAL